MAQRVEAGWHEDERDHLKHRYYPKSMEAGDYAIIVDMRSDRREVYTWLPTDDGGYNEAGGDFIIPDHIQTVDEAKAWALAVWRMQ